MKRTCLLLFLAIFCVVLAVCPSVNDADEDKVLLVQDAFDPMGELIDLYAGNSLERLTPYQLGLRLSGLDGMAVVFGTQARPFQQYAASTGYMPLYSAKIVIAINKNGNSAGSIHGWRSLFESEALVLMPHHATEGGRLTAIAIARGLGAKEGDLTPVIEACAYLHAQGRLNHQDEYGFPGYNYMYRPDRLSEHDAVVMWDYQAAKLTRIANNWDIIIPEEGSFTVDCGILQGESSDASDNLLRTKVFLLSEPGRQALSENGFSTFAGEVDLSAWDLSRLTYNADFRRAVLAVKQYGPASILERLLLQSLLLLLFCVAAQRILRRIPRSLYRTTSFYAMLFAALWLMIGTAKTLSLHHDFTRYLWLATYIPRHGMAVCWTVMCYVNRHDKLLSRKSMFWLISISVCLSVFVMANDMHRQVFVYNQTNPATWASRYNNGWGYYLSLLWSFSLIISGIRFLIHINMTRQQRRQMIYAGLFSTLLIGYQISYIAGVPHIVDLDIPTTVAIFILVFSLASQRERFMGASLLELPIFLNSPYGIAVFDKMGQAVYRNTVMVSIRQEDLGKPASAQEYGDEAEILSGNRVFKPRKYGVDNGWALVLEDITTQKRLEQSLQETHKKLEAVQALLVRQTEETRSQADRLAQERYSQHMERLLRDKLATVRHQIDRIYLGDGTHSDRIVLRHIRFLLCICQQRLRFVIRSLETHPLLPAGLVESYAAGLIKDGRRIGLDAVITSSVHGFCPVDVVTALLEAIDCICLYARDLPGTSLICRLEASDAGIAFNALLSWDGERPVMCGAMLPDNQNDIFSGLGGQIWQETEEDGLLTRLHFSFGEVQS